MKSIILLSCLICVQLNAQNCMVGQSPVDILEYDYTASQFRLKGPVKRVTRIHETLNEKGDFETIHGVWGDHYFIDHLNFDEKGNLVVMTESIAEDSEIKYYDGSGKELSRADGISLLIPFVVAEIGGLPDLSAKDLSEFLGEEE